MKIFLLATALLATATTAQAQTQEQLIGRAAKAIESGDWATAEAHYSDYVKSYPQATNLPMILSNMALMQSYQGKDTLAVATLDRAILLAPDDPKILENRGISRMTLGDNEGAKADFDHLLEVDSLNRAGLFYRGSIALNAGDTVAAKKCLLRLREVDPNSESTHKALAALYTKLHDYVAAVGEYDILIAMKPEVETYVGRASNNLMLERLDEASIDIAEAMRLDSADGEAYLIRAALNKRRYQFDDAEADGRRAIELGVDPRRVNRLIGSNFTEK